MTALEVGAACRILRERRGWTQEHLAFIAGVGDNTVGALERGDRRCRLDIVIAIFGALEIDPFSALAPVFGVDSIDRPA